MLRRAICGVVQGAGQGWEFGLARHWSRLAQTAINSGPTTFQCDVSFPTRQPGESVSPLNRWARLVVPQEVISPESLPS